MKIFRNIQSFLGYLAYKNLMLVFFLYLFLVVVFLFLAFSSILEPYLLSFSIIRFSVFFVLALVSLFSFLVGMRNLGNENYRIAILKAQNFRENLNSLGIMTGEISAKLSILVADTGQTKNPETLNEFIKNFNKILDMKKEKEETEKFLREASGKINSLTTKIYYSEKELFS